MISFKGRLSFHLCLKNKPVKWDINVFILADSHNGYALQTLNYTGKSMESSSLQMMASVPGLALT